jgi:apolipoprotein N-acyltransferase
MSCLLTPLPAVQKSAMVFERDRAIVFAIPARIANPDGMTASSQTGGSGVDWKSAAWRLLLAAGSGALYSLAYPPFFAGSAWSGVLGLMTVVAGLCGLLVALKGQSGTLARAIGFIHGMAVYGIGLSWLVEIFSVFFPVLCMVLAAFTACFAEMQSRAWRRGLSGGWWVAFTVVNWSALEFIRAELFPLRFPWMTAGLAVGPNALLPWIGVYGAGLLVVAAAAILARGQWRLAALPLGVLVAALFFMPRHAAPGRDDPMAVRVGGLQLEVVSLTELMNRTRELPADVQFVVWPEYAVPYDLRKNARDWQWVRELSAERNITLTLGTQVRPDGDEGPWRNIALTIDADGERGEHTKVHTVHFFDDGTPGRDAQPIRTAYGPVGTPICFDCDYEGVVRRMVKSGAELLIVPIMDAASWTARQHDQHAELFRIRACENGRWMFACASSGISQIIDPSGKVHARLDALEQGPLVGTVARRSGLTPYTRFGWLLPWAVLSAASAAWVALLLPGPKPGTAGP